MVYKCIATNRQTGQTVTSYRNGPSMTDVVVKLKEEGFVPLKVTESKPAAAKVKASFNLFKGRVTGKELAIVTRQLATTLNAGLLLTESLETIAEDLDNVYFRNVIKQVKDDIKGGSDFSSSLSKFPKVFPMTYIAIVKSGEASGTLHKTMGNLAKFLESSERLKEKVKTAVQYPSFVLGFAMVVVAVIVLFLIPKFSSMFISAGAKLPLLTRIVVGVSQFCIHYIALFIILGFVGTIAFLTAMKKSQAFRRGVDSLIIRIPVMGKEIIHKALVSRFCRTCGYLFGAGVGLSQSLEISAEVVSHIPMSEAIRRIKERVIAGSSISQEMRKHTIFPKLTSKMISVGERTGNLSEMFNKTADYYDDELENSLARLTSMIEPILIIFIGGVVLIVVLALYLPIFHMSSAIR